MCPYIVIFNASKQIDSDTNIREVLTSNNSVYVFKYVKAVREWVVGPRAELRPNRAWDGAGSSEHPSDVS